MIFEGRIVWLFREPRSGSTWLSNYLAEKLNRQFRLVDNMSVYNRDDIVFFQKSNDENMLLNTHCFRLIHSMKNYTNPVLIRCYRKNTFEQILSLAVTQRTHFYNIHDDIGRVTFENDIQRLENIGIRLEKKQVENYINLRNKMTDYWNQYAKQYENYEFCYEELVQGCEIFNFGKVSMQGYTEVLPDNYKSRVFVNYDEIKEWCNQLDRTMD
jgi:LPS sulfotransferase NodH